MLTFFYGWRRKVGCVTLVLATMSIGGWIRSLLVSDVAGIGNNTFGSVRGGIWWYKTDDLDLWEWGSETIDPNRWIDAGNYWDLTSDHCAIPYWSIVIPLTLLSAYLLLSKPRRKPNQPDEEPIGALP